ncbi:hypothetical protein ACHAXT_002485 [Thalassiosira profunda]
MTSAKASLLRVLNAVAYWGSVLMGLGMTGIPNNLRARAVASWWLLWSLVMLAQLICMFSAMAYVWKHRVNHPLLIDCVGFHYIYLCLVQVAGSSAFGMARLPIVLQGCVLLEWTVTQDREHGVISATFEHENRRSGPEDGGPSRGLGSVLATGDAPLRFLAAPAVSVIGLAIASLVWLFAFDKPRYTLTLLMAWAMYWMSLRLHQLKPLIGEFTTLSSTKSEAWFVSASVVCELLVALTLIRFVHHFRFAKQEMKAKGATGNDEDVHVESLYVSLL